MSCLGKKPFPFFVGGNKPQGGSFLYKKRPFFLFLSPPPPPPSSKPHPQGVPQNNSKRCSPHKSPCMPQMREGFSPSSGRRISDNPPHHNKKHYAKTPALCVREDTGFLYPHPPIKEFQMKTVTRRFCTLIAMAMVFTFAACQPEPEPDKDKNNKNPEIPAELQGTIWTHSTYKDKISFEKESITIEPLNSTAVKFSLLDIEPNDQIKQVILFFNKEKTNDTITYKKNDDSIAVNFKSTLTSSNGGNGWKKGDDDGSEPLSNFEFTLLDKFDCVDIKSGQALAIPFYNVYSIDKYLGNNTDIIIPSKGPNGNPVAVIGGKLINYVWVSAFEGKIVNSIIFPESVIFISEDTFTNNTTLTKVVIPSNISLSHDFNNPNIKTPFPGNLKQVYLQNNYSGGTYTRTDGSNNWIKISN
jgi:hypothetical protein